MTFCLFKLQIQQGSESEAHIIMIKTRCTHPDFGTEFGNTGGRLRPMGCHAATYEKMGWNRIRQRNS